MGTVLFTSLARKDLKEMRDFIAQDKPMAASKYLAIIKQKCELLANYPTLGVQRQEYCGLYKFPIDNYLIFYRISTNGIDIIRILHSSRDVDLIINNIEPVS